jgi:hypothetical protein
MARAMISDEITGGIVDAADARHKGLGPGLLDSVYERLLLVHPRKMLTYLRLLELPVGLLINFGAPALMQELRRVVIGLDPSASPRLRVNQFAGDESLEPGRSEPGEHLTRPRSA